MSALAGAATSAPPEATKRALADRYSIVEPTGCWVWSAARTWGGYGVARICGVLHYAHRASYEMHVGPIPDGLQIDHLCRNRACINPDHLEPVTPAENCYRGESPWAQRRRQTHCIHGHEFTPENTYIRREGWRQCKTCNLERDRARRKAAR